MSFMHVSFNGIIVNMSTYSFQRQYSDQKWVVELDCLFEMLTLPLNNYTTFPMYQLPPLVHTVL